MPAKAGPYKGYRSYRQYLNAKSRKEGFRNFSHRSSIRKTVEKEQFKGVSQTSYVDKNFSQRRLAALAPKGAQQAHIKVTYIDKNGKKHIKRSLPFDPKDKNGYNMMLKDIRSQAKKYKSKITGITYQYSTITRPAFRKLK